MNGPAYRLHFSPQAQHDLMRLEAFLWDSGDPLAEGMMAFVLAALDVLTHQPGVGRPVGNGLRELIIRRGRAGYLARYQLSGAQPVVRILRIRHQRESGYTEDEV